MRSTFGSLYTGATGLAAQRRAIETAGHNIVNANTPGYSRQKVDLGAITGGSSMIHTGTDVYGGGVEILSQTRVVDAFLIQRANDERGIQGQTTELQKTWSRVETVFNEPGENGLAAQLEAFWDAWDAVAVTPDDLGARSALLQRGIAIADTFGEQTRTLDAMSVDVLQRADAITVEVNGIASQIAALNEAIVSATQAGTPPNDLLDQRDELVRTLSTAIDVRTRTDERGSMAITVGGAALVSGTRSNQLSLDTTVPGAAVLRISNSTVGLSPQGGQLGGLLQSANAVIPGQQAAIDSVALQLATVVNAQHQAGQDLQDPPVAGGQFFSATDARDFQLDPALLGRPDRVAAATLGAGRFDGSNGLAMAELAGLPAGPDARYRSMIAELGVNAQTANRRAELQDQLTLQVDQQREAVSGVSIDEEMTNLVSFQQAYQASARYITAVDEMLERLINGTGLVGR